MAAPPLVVHLINHLGRGGTERQLYLTLSAMDPKAFRHRVVVFNPSRNLVWDGPLEAAGVAVESMPASLRGVPRRLLWLTRRLRALRPAVVHSWSVHDNPYAGLAGRLAGAPVRWGSLRGSLAAAGFAGLPAPLRWACLHGVQAMVVNCRELGAQLEQAGVAARRVRVLPNSVERSEPPPRPYDLSDLGLSPDEPLVGIVGNLREVKNLPLFIDAMARVLPKVPGAKAMLVGQPLASENELPQQLQQRIDAAGIGERCLLAGFRGEIPQLMHRLTVVCLTSHSEGSPNSILEAMAAGRPVVATAVGGVPELVEDGVSGYLVPPGDHQALARRVEDLLLHPRRAEAFGAAGQRRARQELSPSAGAQRLATLYRQALGSGRGAGP
ncbi:MAG: glycosyltransferase [Acidobacteriota bacterium]